MRSVRLCGGPRVREAKGRSFKSRSLRGGGAPGTVISRQTGSSGASCAVCWSCAAAAARQCTHAPRALPRGPLRPALWPPCCVVHLFRACFPVLVARVSYSSCPSPTARRPGSCSSFFLLSDRVAGALPAPPRPLFPRASLTPLRRGRLLRCPGACSLLWCPAVPLEGLGVSLASSASPGQGAAVRAPAARLRSAWACDGTLVRLANGLGPCAVRFRSVRCLTPVQTGPQRQCRLG